MFCVVLRLQCTGFVSFVEGKWLRLILSVLRNYDHPSTIWKSWTSWFLWSSRWQRVNRHILRCVIWHWRRGMNLRNTSFGDVPHKHGLWLSTWHIMATFIFVYLCKAAVCLSIAAHINSRCHCLQHCCVCAVGHTRWSWRWRRWGIFFDEGKRIWRWIPKKRRIGKV